MERMLRMKMIGIDYGDARTGISISDPTGFLAGSPQVIREWNRERLLERLLEIIAEERVEQIVLGLPKNMDGTEGERAQKSRELGQALAERSGVPLAFWDERQTTVAAHAILHAAGKKMKRHKESVDAVAASLILQGYLDANRGR
jgi:putative Holliday junction resolvase